MIETINYVIKEIDDKTVIIPGHGQLSNKQDLDECKSYDDIFGPTC